MMCSVASCDRDAVAKGFCKLHWHRNRRYGDPVAGFYQEGEGPDWLAEHVHHQGDECLIWPFGRNGRGYGAVGQDGDRVGAHRAMCILAHGQPPTPEHHAAHSCGNGHLGCVHPGHLSWRTPAENQQDRLKHGTSSRGTGNACAKINESQVREIRRRLASGETNVSIAEDYDLTHYAVSAIKRRKTWAWLT